MNRLRRLCVLLPIALAVPLPAADDAVPTALLAARGEAFAAAFDAPGDEALAAFVRDHLERRVVAAGYTPRFIESVRRDYDLHGPFAAHQVQVLHEGRVVFVLARRAKSGVWLNYQFRVHPEDEHRLQLVFVSLAVEPMPRPTTPLASPETSAWLDRFVDAMAETQPFAGVAYVARQGRKLHSLARGLAVAETGEAMTRASRLNMASGSKLFAAVAILQLDQAGKLSIDRPLLEALPDFPDRAWAASVTLRQLLTHTAGAGNYWDEQYEREWREITTTAQFLPHVLRHLRASPAGEFSYSNSGFLILGLVVEAVSGESFYDSVRRRIFEPAGMTATGYPLRSRREPGVAGAYRLEVRAGAVVPGSYLPVELGERGSAAGGAATTVDDLARFVRALEEGRLLDAAHFREMTRPQVAMGVAGESYGLGTIVRERDGVRSWGHGGTARGTHFDLAVYPDLELVTIVMSNYDSVGGYELAKALDDLARAEPTATGSSR